MHTHTHTHKTTTITLVRACRGLIRIRSQCHVLISQLLKPLNCHICHLMAIFRMADSWPQSACALPFLMGVLCEGHSNHYPQMWPIQCLKWGHWNDFHFSYLYRSPCDISRLESAENFLLWLDCCMGYSWAITFSCLPADS